MERNSICKLMKKIFLILLFLFSISLFGQTTLTEWQVLNDTTKFNRALDSSTLVYNKARRVFYYLNHPITAVETFNYVYGQGWLTPIAGTSTPTYWTENLTGLRRRMYPNNLTDSISIGTQTPTVKFEVNGDIKATVSSYTDIAIEGIGNSGTGVYGTATTGNGISGRATGTNASGVRGYSSGNGVGVVASASSSGIPFEAVGQSSSSSSSFKVAKFAGTPTGTPANGFGLYQSFSLENDNYESTETGRLYNKLTNVRKDKFSSSFELWTAMAGSLTKKLEIDSTGNIIDPSIYSAVVGGTNAALFVDNTGLIGKLTSSRRFKHNITPMENINWLYKLKPVNFLYKKDTTNTKQYGLIAEDVEKVNKSFITYDKNGLPETVEYSKLIAPMLKAIQDQQKEIQELKARIRVLEKKE
jgi:hypothetical protein